jgi:hypothetical protein
VKRPPDRVRSIFSVAAWLNFFACDTDDEHWYDGAARRRITETISWLQDRIESRFPGAGLSRLCSNFCSRPGPLRNLLTISHARSCRSACLQFFLLSLLQSELERLSLRCAL